MALWCYIYRLHSRKNVTAELEHDKGRVCLNPVLSFSRVSNVVFLIRFYVCPHINHTINTPNDLYEYQITIM